MSFRFRNYLSSDSFRFNTRISFPTNNQISISSGNKTPTLASSTTDFTSTSTTITTPKPTTSTTTVPSTTTTQSTTTTTASTITTPTTITTETTTAATTTAAPVPPPKTDNPVNHAHGDAAPPSTSTGAHPPGTSRPGLSPSGKPTQPIAFDIFHNGQPTEAVVVGSRVTLSFTPYFAIPRMLLHNLLTLSLLNFSFIHVNKWMPSRTDRITV